MKHYKEFTEFLKVYLNQVEVVTCFALNTEDRFTMVRCTECLQWMREEEMTEHVCSKE